MMISITELILEYICPIAGGLTATLMFAAPLPDVYHAITVQGQLGALNPLPWAFMLGNCYGWILYSFIQRNFFVYCANVPGFLFAIWLNVQAVKLQYKEYYYNSTMNTGKQVHDDKELQIMLLVAAADNDRGRDAVIAKDDEEVASTTIEEGVEVENNNDKVYINVDKNISSKPLQASSPETLSYPSSSSIPMTQDVWILFLVLVWLLLTSVIGFQQDTISPDSQQLLIGCAVNLNLVVFYGAPLSTIWQVLQTQSSISIHVPTMLTNTANGIFWCAYGLTVQDWFIAVPNGIGATLGIVQMILKLSFPVQPKVQPAPLMLMENSNTPTELLEDNSPS